MQKMKNEKDTMLRMEMENGSIAVDKKGVMRITAPVITIRDLVDETEVREMDERCVSQPVPCAEEIVRVMEKHKILVRDIDEVLEIAKDIALSDTFVGSGRIEDTHAETLEVHIDAEALSRAVRKEQRNMDARYGIREPV